MGGAITVFGMAIKRGWRQRGVTMDRDGWSGDPLGRLISQYTDTRRLERQWERRFKRDCQMSGWVTLFTG